MIKKDIPQKRVPIFYLHCGQTLKNLRHNYGFFFCNKTAISDPIPSVKFKPTRQLVLENAIGIGEIYSTTFFSHIYVPLFYKFTHSAF